MKGKGGYVPPLYVPLGQSEEEFDYPAAVKPAVHVKGDGDGDGDGNPKSKVASRPVAIGHDPTQWSSGICACCDDTQSCCVGTVCPCYLFGRNAEFLGSGTLAGSCMTHFILWGILNSLCCLCTGGLLSVMPGSVVACYACGYRKALRTKYNIQEAPCGDLTTHLFCHLCAVCQEYREIRERSDGSVSIFAVPAITAPAVQTMEPNRIQVELA